MIQVSEIIVGLKKPAEMLQALSVWKLNGDLVGTAVAYGLHCYQDPPKVTVKSEMIKRYADKVSCDEDAVS